MRSAKVGLSSCRIMLSAVQYDVIAVGTIYSHAHDNHMTTRQNEEDALKTI